MFSDYSVSGQIVKHLRRNNEELRLKESFEETNRCNQTCSEPEKALSWGLNSNPVFMPHCNMPQLQNNYSMAQYAQTELNRFHHPVSLLPMNAAAAAAEWPPWAVHRVDGAPIYINNNTLAMAQSRISTKREVPTSCWATWFACFWKSNWNKVLLLSIFGCAALLVFDWWEHNRRMRRLQRVVDSRMFYRLNRLLFETLLPWNVYSH